MDASYLNQTEYTPVGDIGVLSLCLAFGMFLLITRVKKSRRSLNALTLVVLMLFCAVTNIIYRIMLGAAVIRPVPLCLMRIISHSFYSLVQIAYILYLRVPLWLRRDNLKRFALIIGAVAFAPVLIDTAGMIFGFGFRVENNAVTATLSPYQFSYLIFVGAVLFMLIRYRSRLVSRVFYVMVGLNVLGLLLITIQDIFHQTSYATLAYFLPITGIVFVFHTNPFDTDTGAVNERYFYEEVATCIERNTPLLIMSCSIADLYAELKSNTDLRKEFFRFFRQSSRRGVLYRFSDNRIILTIKQKGGRSFDTVARTLIDEFDKSYGRVGLDYRLIVCTIIPELKKPDDYIKLIKSMEDTMPANTMHRINDEDIRRFCEDSYILSQLEDIARRGDLKDERVLVYCQPVFNIVTGIYDTAEALMRLRLPDVGMVFPDKFIPLAEEHDLISALSRVILNKTCSQIHDLLAEKYIVNRISVNFSTLDLRRKNFRSGVIDIIQRNDIPFDKIAIEITESRSEIEFNQMKQKITELQSLGIKFYLDDFGTGYSNFERIMELPFDIIKFDRSLLIESVKNDSSKFMVSTFANMFNSLNYSVLFEGVEDDRDEQYCVGMHASYLQGYKYSRPIPIEGLRDFLTKEAS